MTRIVIFIFYISKYIILMNVDYECGLLLWFMNVDYECGL